ncbi:hypothetical protein [Paenarthrobacter sp. YJN-5]|uniref:hypothetical protein n=1 Tax=Paenarthrobacter sp. YJN-5 TaxID=2735316 RepID=UPI0018785374|nr:hypothetical protein [Paenarthrobacter sp. YJN-5]QOT19744.1 hypothetical protein HMI59_24090 [Paenarthrobacter sp. YJN-5]
MTTEKPNREDLEQAERARKALETSQLHLVRAKSLAKDIDRIKRVNGIAAALNRRLGTTR